MKKSPVTGRIDEGADPALRHRSRPTGATSRLCKGYFVVTVSRVAVLRMVESCEVTARPCSTDPLRLKVMVEPGITSQFTPSLEVKAVKVLPVRPTWTKAGGTPVA